MLISYANPHGPVSRDSVARWIKQSMKSAGIDTSVFKSHSTRSASTSAAKVADVPIEDIMATANNFPEAVLPSK